MTEDIRLPDYLSVMDVFGRLDGPMGAAETHGMLAGLFCGQFELNAEDWVGQFISNEQVHADELQLQKDKQVLLALYNVTDEQLDNYIGFELQLLLPDDNEVLDFRIEALGAWCQGFLSGLAFAGVDFENNESEEVEEMLADLLKFSQMQLYDAEQGNESDEAAYVELVEYTRVAVMSIYSELIYEEPPSVHVITDPIH